MKRLRVVLRMGYAVPNPVTSLNPDEGTRYPFALVKATADSVPETPGNGGSESDGEGEGTGA